MKTKSHKETGYDEEGNFDLCLKDKQDNDISKEQELINEIEILKNKRLYLRKIGMLGQTMNVPLEGLKEEELKGYKQGRKDNQPKCQVCKREDCLNILCHADLEVFKRDIRKDAIEEFSNIIIDNLSADETDIRFMIDKIKRDLQ